MHHLSRLVLLMPLLAFVNSCAAQAQPLPPPQAFQVAAVRPDIQEIIREMLVGKSVDERAAAMAKLQALIFERSIATRMWLEQAVLYLSYHAQGMDRWAGSMYLTQLSIVYLRISPSEILQSLAPYLEFGDEPVRDVASEMIDTALVSGADMPALLQAAPKFPSLTRYLESMGATNPSWQLIRKFYDLRSDAAMNTVAAFYLTPDDLRSVQRNQKLLAITIHSHEVTEQDETAALEKEALRILEAMADHSHWGVRAYVITMLREVPWINGYVMLAVRLERDQNPLVASMAKELLSEGKRR